MKCFAEFITEGVVHVDSYTEETYALRELVGQNLPITELVQHLDTTFAPHRVRFVTYTQLKNLVERQGIKNFPAKPANNTALIMAVADDRLDGVYVVYNTVALQQSFFTTLDFRTFAERLATFVRHEVVHLGQIARQKENGYHQHQHEPDVDVMDEEGYLTNPQEMMAMARTIIDELRNQFTPKQVAHIIRTPQQGMSRLLDKYYLYLKPGSAPRRQFFKYLFAYLRD